MVRSRFAWFAGALAVAGLAIEACSGDPEEPAPAASPDAGGGTGERAAFDAGQPEPACDPDADLLAKVTDASIADGSSTTGVCLSCARARCSEAIAECTGECACQRIVSDALGCWVTTQQITCAAELANVFVKNVTRQHALALVGCVKSACTTECAIDGGAPDPVEDGGDGG
jgi:hypothetical protein